MTKKGGFANSGFILVITSHALNHVYDSLLPILYPAMISELHLSYSLVGMFVMGYRLTSGALQIMMGFLSRFVRRKILLGLGMIWQSITNSLISVSRDFEHILISRSLAGIGSSPQHPIGASYIAENFPRGQLGRALGINVVAASIGRFVTPFVGSLLLSSLGWRTTLLVFSIPGMIVGLAFLPIAESKSSQNWSGASSFKSLLEGVNEVMRNRTVLTIMVVEMVMAFRIGASDFLPSYFMRDLGMTSLNSGILFAIFLGAGLPAPYLWGYLSDKLERRRVVMLTMGAASILWYLLPYSRGASQLVSILVMLGFVCQGIGGVIQAFVADATSQANRDLIYGIYFTLTSALGSFSPVIMGHLADSFGFQISFSYVGLISLLAVISAYFMR